MPTKQSMQLAAQAWCHESTKNLEMDTNLAITFAEILDKHRHLQCPDCGADMVISDEAGIDALNQLADDKNADIIKAGDALYRVSVDFSMCQNQGNERKLEDRLDAYSKLRPV